MRQRGWQAVAMAASVLGAAAWAGTNQDCVNNGQMGSPFAAGTGTVTVDCQEGPFDPPGANCGGAPGQVSGAGATLFVDFFRSPSGYNDWIDADADGRAGEISVFPFSDPLATLWPPSGTITTHWMFQYRSVGSVNGYNEFVANQTCHAIPLSIPAEGGLFSQFEYATGGVRTWGGPYANNSGTPVEPCEIEFSFLDVPSVWGTRVPDAAGVCVPGGAACVNDLDCLPEGRCSTGPRWNKEPAEPGYGLDPMPSSSGYISNLQSLSRQCGTCTPGGEPCTTNEPATLYCATGGAVCTPAGAPVSLNTNPVADDDTIRDFIGAWVPVLYIANRGTGLRDVKYSEMQFLFVTGRMPSGENLVATTRSVGSGTRNAHMNSSGIDTSWGRGDNFGPENGVTSNFNLGPNTQQTNGQGSSQTEQALEMRRLAVAYTGMAGPSRAVEDATGGRYELLNLCKDVDTDGNPLCDCAAPNTCPEGPKHCAINTSISCTTNANCTPTSSNGNCVADDAANPNNGYVRPSVNAVLDNDDACCGYTIGGNGSFVVRGERNANRQLADPEYQPGIPLDNQAVADYINNIADSIRDYVLAGNFEAGSCNFSEVCSTKRCSVSLATCTGTGQGTCAGGNVCQFIPCDTAVPIACPGGFGTCIPNNTCLTNADCPDRGCSVTHAECNVNADCIDETCNLGTLTCTQTGGPCAVDTDCPARGQTCDTDYCRGSSNMPAQYLATNFFLPQGIDAQQSLTDGMVFVGGGVTQALQNYIRANSVITVPAYGSVNAAGRVPVRNGLSGGNKYSDGSTTGSYTYWNGAAFVTNFTSGQRLACRNRIQGDFNKDCLRDINDASELVKAHYGPRAWQQTAVAMGSPPCPVSPICDNGNQAANNAIAEVLGDFDGDGNFTKEDLRYFADGLAMDGGALDRKDGAIAIDNAILAAGQALPWNDPAQNLTIPPAAQPSEPTFTAPLPVNDCTSPFLATAKPYAVGDFRGDVAGANPTAGAQPLGWDSVVDDQDIDYCWRQSQIGDWSNIDDAVYIDLSCDMDGDLDVDGDDVDELILDILGTHYGDVDLDGDRDGDDNAIVTASINGPNSCIAARTCGWADGDTNCDGVVDAGDLAIFATLEPRNFSPLSCPTWNLATDARTRAITIDAVPAATASGSSMQAAVRILSIDLENPIPPNNNPVGPCCPPGNFVTFDTAVNAVCDGGNNQGYRCTTGTDCPGSTCPAGVGCTAPGEANGCARWVGPPQSYLEANDNPGLGNYRAARLQCSPYYHDWATEGPVSIVGAEIVPSSTYEVLVYPATCKGTESTCAFTFPSPPLQVRTRRAGDIATPFEDGVAPLTEPAAIDVTNAVNKFRNLVGSPPKSISQVQPNAPDPNADINAIDIVTVVDNTRGFGYTYSGPCVCPSTVTCNLTPCAGASNCTGPHGAGATCIKTCTSGPRTGQPCNNNLNCGTCVGGPATGNGAAGIPCDANADCASGNCGLGTCPTGATPGFCRDRCGRCN